MKINISISAETFVKNQTVVVKIKKNEWYAGKITSILEQGYSIKFKDGLTAEVTGKDLKHIYAIPKTVKTKKEAYKDVEVKDLGVDYVPTIMKTIVKDSKEGLVDTQIVWKILKHSKARIDDTLFTISKDGDNFVYLTNTKKLSIGDLTPTVSIAPIIFRKKSFPDVEKLLRLKVVEGSKLLPSFKYKFILDTSKYHHAEILKHSLLLLNTFNSELATKNVLLLASFLAGELTITHCKVTSPVLQTIVKSYIPEAPEEPLINVKARLPQRKQPENSRNSLILDLTGFVPDDDDMQESSSALKRRVCKSITVVPESVVQQHLDGWATSSSSTESIILQLVVSDMLGIKHNEYFKEKMVTRKLMLDPERKAEFDNDAVLVAKAMYANTQKLLKEKGIKELFLYRGMYSLQSLPNLVGNYEERILNPLSSFSSNILVAYEFTADGEFFTKSQMLGMWVPAANIFSMPGTGLGCFSECEFVVIGGEYELLVDPLFYDCAIGKYMYSESIPSSQLYKAKRSLGTDLSLENLMRLTTPSDLPAMKKFVVNYAKVVKKSPQYIINKIKGISGNEAVSSMKKVDTVNIDADVDNADWCKQSWDLHPYGSKEFFKSLKPMNLTLDEFKQLPVYKHAVRKGSIKE